MKMANQDIYLRIIATWLINTKEKRAISAIGNALAFCVKRPWVPIPVDAFICVTNTNGCL